jgi:transmembrane sensor
MAKVSNINQRRQIRREAEDWIILLDRGEKFTDQDKESLRKWMARSPVHIQELKSANRFWQNQELTSLMVPVASSATSSFSITRMSAYAACLLLGAFLIWQTFFIYTSNGLYVTGIGQQQTVELDDGSVVELNTDTQLRVEYNSDHRNIRLLKGEAHFKVAKNREKPFRVYADNNFVEAVGTAFSVKKQGSLVDILVTEGRVCRNAH